MKERKEKLTLKKMKISQLQNINKIRGGGTTDCDGPGGGTEEQEGKVGVCILGSKKIIYPIE